MPKQIAACAAALMCAVSFCASAQILPTPSSTSATPPVALSAGLRAAGEAVIQAIHDDDLKAIEARFAIRMRDLFPHDKFAGSLADTKLQIGSLQSCDAPTGSTRGASIIAEYQCKFSLTRVVVRLAWNAKGQLDGLFFQPLPPEAKAIPLPENVREEEVITGAEGWPLPATVLLPASKQSVPWIVFVQGSGPNDRDETIGPNKPLRDLAYGLSAQGIASLRYDKRTKALAARFKSELRDWTFDDEVVDDAVAALAQVAARNDVGPIFIAGHSLGAVLAPRIAAAAGRKGIRIDGVVMIAPPLTPLADLIVYQYEFLSLLPVPTITAQTLDDISTRRNNVRRLIEQGKAEPPAGPLLLDMPASAWLDIGRYDPVAALLDQPGLPALLIFGGRDFQVPIQEKRLWEARIGSRANTRLVEFPSVSHLMIEGKGSMSPAEYGKPGLVYQEVIDRIATWIKGQPRAQRTN